MTSPRARIDLTELLRGIEAGEFSDVIALDKPIEPPRLTWRQLRSWATRLGIGPRVVAYFLGWKRGRVTYYWYQRLDVAARPEVVTLAELIGRYQTVHRYLVYTRCPRRIHNPLIARYDRVPRMHRLVDWVRPTDR